jgi:hypothetical protein
VNCPSPNGLDRLDWPAARSLSTLAAHLGLSVRDQRRLKPQATASRRSLSSRYGLGAFPWHTDSVQQVQPPRWLLLRSLGESNTPTCLLDGTELTTGFEIENSLSSGSWLIDLGDRSFFASVVRSTDRAIRWNPDLMRPANAPTAETDEKLRRALESVKGQEHLWRTGEVLLIDNFRWLHSRPAISAGERKRELERILCD